MTSLRRLPRFAPSPRLAALPLAAVLSLPLVLQAQEVELSWQLEPGAEHVYRQVDRSSTGTPMGAMSQVQTQTLHHDVLDVRGDGTARLRVTYGPVRFEMDGPMGRQEFDSTSDDVPDDPMVAIMGQLVGESFEFDLAPDGRVTELSGMAELFEAMIESVTAEVPGGAAMVEEMLGGMFSDEAMQGTLQQSFQVLPAGAVGPGSEWSHEIAVPLPFGTVRSEYHYTLTEVASEAGRRVARIAVSGTTGELEVDPASPIAAMMELTGGELTGELTFDVDRGMLLRSSIESVLSVSMMGQTFETESVQEMELIEG